MKKISIFKYLAISVLLCYTGKALAQPVIRVPATCNVVVAGTGVGAVTGMGGQVGDGGVVLMPDPFDLTSPSGDFNYIPNSTTVTGWTLKGDLSVQTANVPPAAGVYSAGAVNTLNIESYNKALRPAEQGPIYPLSNSKWGRSKGRVKVTYTATCGGSITFDVYKMYDNTSPSWVPPIVGPNCLLPLSTYTYSVDQIASDNATDAIGFDSYYWSGIPGGATGIYTSADNSSITFTTGATVSAFTIQCCYGRANKWDGDGVYTSPAAHVTCVTKSVGVLPGAPSYVTSPPTCLPTGTGSFNIVYPNAVAPLTYTWTAPNTGWSINPPSVGPTNTTVTVNTPNNNPGILILTIGGTSCTVTPISYQINRSLNGTTLIVPFTSSPGSNCMLAGSSNNQFFLGTNASANNTTWTVTSVPAAAAANITLSPVLNQPSSTVAVAIGANAPVNATYTLTATASTTPACNATSATYNFNVKPITPSITAGASCVVPGALTAQTYTCTNINGASYNWVFPPGWSPATTTTTVNTVTVTPSSASAVLNGNATVTATGLGGCNSAVSANYAINYSPVTPLGVTSPNCLSAGASNATISVTNPQSFGSYSVTSVPAGITGGNTSGINMPLTIPAGLAAGTYQLFVTHTTPLCGSSVNSTGFPITLNANTASVTLSPGPGICNSDVYIASGGSSYNWFINGAPAVPSANVVVSSNILQLKGNGPTPPTSVCVDVITAAGCTTRVCANLTGATHTTKLAPKIPKSVIYPNPNDGNFSIQIEEVKDSASATISDLNGKKLGNYRLSKGENKIKTKNISTGSYIIIIEIDGKIESKKLIVK